ncbi:L protein [Sclerotinia sclerotiorum rhabdovirus 1]|nr:L protein [Sclerotinia sclerotiorum rhabdovirus 1]
MENLLKLANKPKRFFEEGGEEDWDLYNDQTSDSQNFFDEEFLVPQKKTKHEILAQRDYNLNSPLLRGKLSDVYLNINSWSNAKLSVVQSLVKDLKDVKLETPKSWKSPDDLHSWMASLWSRTLKINNASILIKETHDLSKMTDWIPLNFISEVFSKKRLAEDPGFLSIQTKQYLEWFLLWNCVITVMNNVGVEHADFSKLLGCSEVVKELPDRRYLLKGTVVGQIYVTPMFVFLTEEKVVLDREFVLLLKDVSNSRYQSLSCLDLHSDLGMKGISPNLTKLYQKGDAIIFKQGCEGYNSIKMIEAWCNRWFSDSSMDVKPLLPKFQSFGKYFDEEVKEKSKSSYETKVFFDFMNETNDLNTVLTYYGSFRHWGHPFIDYKTGLNNLRSRVQEKREVDLVYANLLASDLAKKVLNKIWMTKKYWAVDITRLDKDHDFYPHVNNNTWPTAGSMTKFGDFWHTLPLKKCFDIPDVVDPSLIYADKSHSITRTEFINHIQRKPKQNIPSIKVLKSFLERPATDWPTFLTQVNNEGISEDELIIGLKAKERELKVEGRYFALLSWRLREYFVMTEYLIKEHFVPLFSGLTMADNYEAVMKKMISSSSNQGTESYESLTIANHIDYSKWCNTQSHDSTHPVFKVMDQFLGYNNLICRTHSFFESCWYYYKDGGPDIQIVDGAPQRISDYSSCWIGQYGGIEGLRQKGWSILSLLNIERKFGKRNTRVQVLAQGDNQVICTQFRPRVKENHPDFDIVIQEIYQNNEAIMDSVEVGVVALGMKINKEETMQSTDYLNYGKIPIYRGVVRSLQTKRWSRISCVTNDSLPNFGNTLGTVTSNALTVAHTLSSCIPPMLHYHWSAIMMYKLVYRFNPTLRMNCQMLIPPESEYHFVLKLLYKDPSLGGIGGMSLTRFLIRGFPDPVTEGLSFWKRMAKTVTGAKSQFCYSFGHPKLKPFKYRDVRKLIENPTSINIPGTTGVENIIKEAVKLGLKRQRIPLRNEIIKEALEYQELNDSSFVGWLLEIKPLFPRFLSEFYAGSYGGIMNSLIGLVQNSKTMKGIFSDGFDKELVQKVLIGEIQSVLLLKRSPNVGIDWRCSYRHAEALRKLSWGGEVLGASIPHPVEILESTFDASLYCPGCSNDGPSSDHLVSVGYEGMINVDSKRGPYRPYLGSSTNEQTSLLQTWDKTSNIPMTKRATKLLNSIAWFVEPNSFLALSLIDMVEKMTGEKIGLLEGSIKRTGTAVHRFSSSRQSAGGFAAQSPSKGSRQLITTDKLRNLQRDNFTVMFQPLILYTQHIVGELAEGCQGQFNYHFHISCMGCIDKVEPELRINSNYQFNFPDVSDKLSKWKPDNVNWFTEIKMPELKEIDARFLSSAERCRVIGYNLGFFGSEMANTGMDMQQDIETMFPVVLINKLNPEEFFEGIASGIVLNAFQHAVYRRHIYVKISVAHLIYGQVVSTIQNLLRDQGFLNLLNSNRFVRYMADQKTGISASYPETSYGATSEFSIHLREKCFQVHSVMRSFGKFYHILGDFLTPKNITLLKLSLECYHHIGPDMKMTSQKLDNIKQIGRILVKVRELEAYDTVFQIRSQVQVFKISEQIRFFAPDSNLFADLSNERDDLDWIQTPMPTGARCITGRKINTLIIPTIKPLRPCRSLLITSLRSYHFATGTYYKLYDIIKSYQVKIQDALICGDGSGGITSLLLRMSGQTRCIFNTLFFDNLPDLGGKGFHGPSAIMVLPPSYRNRCVNAENAWESPSDLRDHKTWNYFDNLRDGYKLALNTIIIDMESVKVEDYEKMSVNLGNFLNRVPIDNLIIKFYHNLHYQSPSIFGTVFNKFSHISYSKSIWESSNSLAFYFICNNRSVNTGSGEEYINPDVVAYDLGIMDEQTLKANDLKRFRRLRHLTLNKPIIVDKFISKENLLGSMLEHYGSRSGTTQAILNSSQIRRNPIETILCLYVDCLNMNIDVTSPCESSAVYPSNGQVIKAGVLFYCFNVWINVLKEDYNMVGILEQTFESQVPIYLYHTKNKKGEIKLGWSFSSDVKGLRKWMDNSLKRSDCGKFLRALMMFPRIHCGVDKIGDIKDNLKSLKMNYLLTRGNFDPFA